MSLLAARLGIDIHEVELELLHVRASRYVSAAGYVLLLYDYFLTLPDEVKLIWPTSWSLVKILFLINRYTVPIFLTVNSWAMSGFSNPPTDTVSIELGHAWTSIDNDQSSAEGISNLLLLLRVHALYGRSRKILILLVIFYILTYASILSTATLALVQLGFEIVIFGMTLYKCLEHAKAQQLHTPLLKTLYRDGFLYFLIIVVIRILNLALWIVAPPSLIYLGLYFIWSLITLLISRLLLNLRNVSSYSQWQAETNVRGLTNMQFAPRTDLDAVPNKTTTTTTGYTNSTRLTDVLEWLEDEKEEGWAEERRAGKRRQIEPHIEVVEHEEDIEMGPVRRGTRRHFIEENGSGPVEIR
ncbi:hypothetical protein FRC08_011481 [Ceratobasidium sp. 394]|nr:hypothetical protein FRC08_011481 [Ceratobasidium sp. 394]